MKIIENEIPSYVIRSIASDYLRLIILPTEKCNLRCTYCYEDFLIGRILPEVKSGIKNLISKRGEDLKRLQLSWFGGEPLLAPRDIIEICHHAQDISKRHPGLRFESDMTTNGVLLDLDMARNMAKAGVNSYQISLDGPKEMHDKSRTTANGEGSYEKIWSNLCALSESDIDFHITLRTHYRFDTWKNLFPLVDEIKNKFGTDSRFSTTFNPIVALGGKNNHEIIRMTKEEKDEITNELNQRVGKKIIDKTSDEPGVCYASTANSFVIRAHGSVGKCTVALNDEKNDIGKINSDGTLTLNRDRYLPWMKGIENGDHFALSCPYSSHIKKTNKNSDNKKIIAINKI